MRSLVTIFIFSLIFSTLKAQSVDTLTLAETYRLVRENAPLLKQFKLNTSSSELKKEAISTANMPYANVFGKAWYQSDAVATPSFSPGMEGLSIDRFQYNFGLEVNQKLFDGGATNKQLQLEDASLRVDNADLETRLYELNELVNQHFFSVLLLEESKDILDLKRNTLQERVKIVSSGVKNGVILRSELEKLEAEIVTVEQQQIDLDYSITSIKYNIKILTGIEKDKSIVLKKPGEVIVPELVDRPEYQLFEDQKEKLERSKTLKGSQLMPKVFAYAQLGYSYPGLNFFENQADPYYIVGGKLSWTLYDWSKTRKEKEIMDVQQESIDIQEEELDKNLKMAAESKLIEIEKLETLMEKDRLIIDKRERITRSASAALDNGTITSAEYLDDLNAEIKSRLDLKKHETQLSQTKAELAVIKGITIE